MYTLACCQTLRSNDPPLCHYRRMCFCVFTRNFVIHVLYHDIMVILVECQRLDRLRNSLSSENLVDRLSQGCGIRDFDHDGVSHSCLWKDKAYEAVSRSMWAVSCSYAGRKRKQFNERATRDENQRKVLRSLLRFSTQLRISYGVWSYGGDWDARTVEKTVKRLFSYDVDRDEQGVCETRVGVFLAHNSLPPVIPQFPLRRHYPTQTRWCLTSTNTTVVVFSLNNWSGILPFLSKSFISPLHQLQDSICRWWQKVIGWVFYPPFLNICSVKNVIQTLSFQISPWLVSYTCRFVWYNLTLAKLNCDDEHWSI